MPFLTQADYISFEFSLFFLILVGLLFEIYVHQLSTFSIQLGNVENE